MMAYQPSGTMLAIVPLTLTSRAVANILQGSASDEAEAMLPMSC